MQQLIDATQDVCEAVVFGNGWLAGAGLALVTVVVVVVRAVGGVRV